MTVDRRVQYEALLTDLCTEAADLDALLGELAPEQWRIDTQSRGWTIAHQISHLEATEQLMHAAITDEPLFRQRVPTTRIKPEISHRELDDPQLGCIRWARWRRSRRALLDEFRNAAPDDRMPWVGPSMSMTSAATARIMEIWAHGEDIYAAVGARRAATPRLRHIAHLSVAARDFSFINRRLAPPTEPFRVEITGPDGVVWTWGPQDAPQRVTGSAYDFALLATRRLHRSDADVAATGRDAVRWLKTIQAFAGAPGPRRRPEGAARHRTELSPGASSTDAVGNTS